MAQDRFSVKDGPAGLAIYGRAKRDPRFDLVLKDKDGQMVWVQVLRHGAQPLRRRGAKTVLRRQHKRSESGMPFKKWCEVNGLSWKVNGRRVAA